MCVINIIHRVIYLKKVFSTMCIILAVACILCFSVIRETVPSAIEMCVTSLIPSVFIFTVLSSVIIDCGLPSFLVKHISCVFNRIFGISQCSAIAVLLGWTAGFPVGANSVQKLYTDGHISRDEAEYLLSFCSVSGISFVFGVIGGVVYDNMKISLLLYTIQIFSSVAVGIIMKGASKNIQDVHFGSKRDFNISETIVSSVKSGVKSTAYICGYVILFSVLCNLIVYIFPSVPEFPIRAALEMTSSSLMLRDFPFKVSLILASALLSWSGMCIHLQIHNCVKNISMKKYYIGKALHVGISSLITVLIPISDNVCTYRECVSVNYRDNYPNMFFLIIFFVVLGCFFLKNDVK